MSIITQDGDVKVDLHDFKPHDIRGDRLRTIIQQAWEMVGARRIRLIHGHGRGRGITPGFVNTNTGYFGLEIRSQLREDKALRQWIHYTTMDCSHNGSTTVKLKKNSNQTRTEFSDDAFPEPSFRHRGHD